MSLLIEVKGNNNMMIKGTNLLYDSLEDMKIEGIYLNDEEWEVKETACSNEEAAIRAVNEALRLSMTLQDGLPDLLQAARLVEKIQIAEARAERAAALARGSHRAFKAYENAQRLANLSRELFHELKAKSHP